MTTPTRKPLQDPAFDARIAAYDASEAFQAEPSIHTAAALLGAVERAPDMAQKLAHAARRAASWLDCARGQGAI